MSTDAPYLLSVGVDVPADLTHEALRHYTDGRSQIHLPESVETHPGFVRGTLYERVGPRQPGNDWPQSLTLLEIDSLEAMQGFVDRFLGGPRGYPIYRHWTDVAHTVRWRAMWRRVDPPAGQLGADHAPYLRLIGCRNGSPRPAPDSAPHPHAIVDRLRYRHRTEYVLHADLSGTGLEAPGTLLAYQAWEVTTLDPVDTGAGQPVQAVWDCVYRRISSHLRNALVAP